MRKTNYPLVVAYIVFILAVLLLAWWIAGDFYKPYPPATPTPTTYWPTRVTATIVPSATPTKVIHTPIQPTIGYTATPIEPPVTVTSTPIPPTYTPTMTPTMTPTQVTYMYPIHISREYACEMWLFRGNRVVHYLHCRLLLPLTGPFTGSPIFIP